MGSGDKQYKKVFEILEKNHQLTMLEILRDYTPFQNLVATLLSSRTKDSTTIPIVKNLFAAYKTPEDFLKIDVGVLEKALFGIGFYRVKARNIKKLSKIIIEEYGGVVPDTFEQLVSLPGVGRKTANCVLGYVFGKAVIGVDVHVNRISNRFGWVTTKNPEETEDALKKLLPEKLWRNVNMLLVDHGQRVCLPIGPRCGVCKIKNYCVLGRKLS